MATYTSIYPESIFSSAFETYNKVPHIGINEFRTGFKDGVYTDTVGSRYDVFYLGTCVTPVEWLQLLFDNPNLLNANLFWVDDAVPGIANPGVLSKHDHYQTLISISPVVPEVLEQLEFNF